VSIRWMTATLPKTPGALGTGVPVTFSHAMLGGPAGDGTDTGLLPSTREPSKLAQNGPLPWIPAGPRPENRVATGSRSA
jgi:hypothetical protein